MKMQAEEQLKDMHMYYAGFPICSDLQLYLF